MKKILIFLLLLVSAQSQINSRLKDVVHLQGIKKNQIYGVGLVVGLNGSGDRNSEISRKALKKYIEDAGLKINEESLASQNVAFVSVSADLQGFQLVGDVIDVQVASLGDAVSLEGGVLLQSALRGADDNVYASAQGVLYSPESGSTPLRMLVPGGAIIEKEILSDDINTSNVILIYKEDSMQLINETVNMLKENYSDVVVTKRGVKNLSLDFSASEEPWDVFSQLMNEELEFSSRAKIVIDKASGIVVVGGDVRVAPAYISLPGVEVEFSGADNRVLSQSTTIQDLATEFLAMGMQAEQISSVLIALKSAGAINADIITQ